MLCFHFFINISFIPDIPPKVISSQTKTMLDEYCSSRHVIRNIYSIKK